MKQNKIYTYGKHALEEALEFAPHALLKVFFEPRDIDKLLLRKIEAAGVATAKLGEGVARADLKRGASHQGVIGQISLHKLMVPYQTFLDTLQPTPATALVLLCGVEDPHNTGAIIRSAAGFGASGVLMPEKGQAPVTGTVIKVSAGMAFRIPLVTIESVPQTIRELKQRGFKVYGLAGESAVAIGNEPFAEPAVFVLGNEGQGISGEVRNLCDKMLSIPMHPKCESLNVAAAGAVALHSWSAHHTEALAAKES